MRKSLSVLLVACATLMASANAVESTVVSGKIRCSNNSEVILAEGVQYNMRDFGTEKIFTPVKSRKANANEQKATVTLKLNGTGNHISGTVYNKDMVDDIRFSGKEGSIEVPLGTYDFCIDFYGAYRYFMIKENVTVTGDMTVEFNQDEANVPMEFHYFNENGKELHLDINDENGEVETPGTASNIIKLTGIMSKEYGKVASIMSMGYHAKGMPEDFFINKLSDRYFIGQSATIKAGSHYYAFKTVVKKFDNTIHNTNPADLAKLSTKFTTSPAMQGDEYVDLPGVETTFINDGYMVSNTRIWGQKDPADGGNVITFIDCPIADVKDNCRMNMAARPVCTDSYVEKNAGGDTYQVFSFIVSPLAMGNAKQGVKYEVSCNDLNNVFNNPEGETEYKVFPGHPEFSFATSGSAHFGNSVPLLSYRAMRLEKGAETQFVDAFHYMGRLGEMRETDVKHAKFETKEEGSIVENTITNTNVKVDGIDGKNLTVVKYDYSKEDNTAPTFQMLSFKDADGNLCDRFTTPAGAKMIVTGGDFNYVANPLPPYVGYFTCAAPASVKALYAPHGTDAWTELTLTENADKYFMPFFGHFYEADLSGVTVEEEGTWFDLRLEMADATGNYQKQLIAPAFKVDYNSSSISDVVASAKSAFIVNGKMVMLADGNVANITVHAIDGRTLQSAFANGIDLSGMDSGIYIITATTKGGNVASTKVAL